jgi:hypothetical protein
MVNSAQFAKFDVHFGIIEFVTILKNNNDKISNHIEYQRFCLFRNGNLF